MKIRTDFVTNSSSSSFIFSNKTDTEQLYKHFHEKAKQYRNIAESLGEKESDYWDYYNTASIFNNIEQYITEPNKLSLNDIMEILGWYTYKLAANITKQSNFNINTITEKQRNILFADTLTSLVGCYECTDENTLEYKENDLLYDVWQYASLDKLQIDLISNYYTEWVEFFNKYKLEPYKLLIDILDCKLIFFESEISQNSLVEKEISKIKTCVYKCNHMG